MSPQRDQPGNVVLVGVAWSCAVLSAGYMLPWAIAATRGKANHGSIAAINLLLGWTIVGWVAALVMACGTHRVGSPVRLRGVAEGEATEVVYWPVFAGAGYENPVFAENRDAGLLPEVPPAGLDPWFWVGPPAWPSPPPQWLPAPDWRPDPAWPPAPRGWTYWRRERPTPRPSRALLDEAGLQARPAAVAPTTEMTWQAAETLAEQHMRRIGFSDAAVTASGADGGLDVVSAQAVAQVKHHATPVGAPALQQTVGAAPSAAWVLFYALAGYTRAATEYAARAKVALFQYDTAGRVSPLNEVARFLAGSADTDTDARSDAFYAEQEIREETQLQFDRAWRAFSDLAQAFVHDASLRGSHTAASRAAAAELERVLAVVEYVGEGTQPVNVVLDHIEVIDQATERLKAAARRCG